MDEPADPRRGSGASRTPLRVLRSAGECKLAPSFHVEHIIATKHRGSDAESNLALACDHCNLHKGANLSGIDPDPNALTRLFNPRIDAWENHFERDGPYIRARTAVGRTTEWVLQLNAQERVTLRRFLTELDEE